MTAAVTWALCAAGVACVYIASARFASRSSALLACLALVAGVFIVVPPTMGEAAIFAVVALLVERASSLIERSPRLATAIACLPAAVAIVLRPGMPTPSAVADVLFCTQHGGLATSAALWFGAVGVVWAAVREPRRRAWLLGALLLLVIALAGGHRSTFTWRTAAGAFLAATPLCTLGLAWFIERVTALSARHPARVAALLVGPLVLWNFTLMAVAQAGVLHIGEAVSFEEIGVPQARRLHDWIGHPWSAPDNLVFAAWNGLSPARFDLLGSTNVDDLSVTTIDIGSQDEAYIGDGWHGPEQAEVTYRWASDHVGVWIPRVPSGHVHLRLRLQPFTYPGFAGQALQLEIGGAVMGRAPVTPGWQWIDFDLRLPQLSRGVTLLTLRFDVARSPVDVGTGRDARALSAAVDVIEIRAGG